VYTHSGFKYVSIISWPACFALRFGEVTCGSVFIVNDDDAEFTEDFFLNLTSQTPAVAQIDPSFSRQTVFILDDDGRVLI